jgi:uncharacterized membrane protein HdeD (DUF308 family)
MRSWLGSGLGSSCTVAAILFGITGFLMVVRPIISAEAVTFLMSMFFLFAGFYQLIASFWTNLPAGVGRP